MSDDLTLRGGGVVAVATDGHLELARVLALLGASCQEWAQELDAVAQLGPATVPTGPLVELPIDASIGREAAVRAAASLRRAGEDASRLGDRLVLTAEAYGDIERTVASLFESTDGAVAWAWGASPGSWVAGAAAIGALVLLGAVVRAAVGAVSEDAGARLDAEAEQRLHDLMATPHFADAVRRVVSSTDDWMMGFGGVPAPIAALL